MSSGVKFGVIGGLVSIIASVIFFLLDMQMHPVTRWIGYVILIICVVLAIISYRKNEGGGYMTIGQGVKTSLQTSLVIAVISLIYFFLYLNVIDPDFIQVVLDETERQLEERGLPDEQIKMSMDMTKKFMTPMWMALWSLIGFSFIGLIVGLISSAILRKDPPVEIQNPEELNEA